MSYQAFDPSCVTDQRAHEEFWKTYEENHMHNFYYDTGAHYAGELDEQ